MLLSYFPIWQPLTITERLPTAVLEAIALSYLGKAKEARLDFEQSRKLYLGQLKSGKISTQEENEGQMKLETVEQHLKLPKS
jgi:hypothetical protein